MRIMYNLAINLWNLGMGAYGAIRGYLLQESGDRILQEDGSKLGF